MISRRLLATGLSAGAVAATAASLISPAAAQAPAAGGETTLDRVRRTKKLRIGAIAGGQPYYRKDLATGQWSGFYIDLAKALAQELEVELDIVETTWGNSVLDLEANKLDVFFGLNPTPKRALVIDFSVPCFSNAYSLIARKDFKPKTWAELNSPEVKIAVDGGSSHDQIVTRLCSKAQITRFKTAQEATLALQTGRVDAQCLVLILALTTAKRNASVGQVLLPTPLFATTSHAGFRREPDKVWRDFVNVFIDFNRSLGLVRQFIVSNMEVEGISESDFPPGVSL